MYFVQDEYGDFIPVAMPQQHPQRRRRGGFWAGVSNFFITVLAIVLICGLGYVFYSSIRPPVPDITTVPTAAVRTRVVAPAPLPDMSTPSGTFETLPAPAPIEMAPAEAVPIIEAPALETAPEIQAMPEYVSEEQVSSDIPADWQQNVFGDPAPVEDAAPVVSEVVQPAPEGGVAPAEVSSGIDPNWRCNVFGDC